VPRELDSKQDIRSTNASWEFKVGFHMMMVD